MQQVTEILFFIFTDSKTRYIRGDTETGHKKAALESDISSRIVKENSDIFGDVLLSSFNDALDKSRFPTALKQVNITPVYKKGKRYPKDKYRPTSIATNVAKTFEKYMFC